VVRCRHLVVTLALALCAPRAPAEDSGARALAAQVPGGAIRVLVVIGDGAWPAGLRLEDEAGAILVAKLVPDAEAAKALDGASQVALAALKRLPERPGAEARSLGAVLALRLVSDWQFARAAGAAVELPADAHPRTVRVRALGGDDAPGAVLASAVVRPDAGPPAPTALRAEPGPTGITLRWTLAAGADAVPAYAYRVARGDAGGLEPLSLHPQLLTRDSAGAANPFTDHAPPGEVTVRYAVGLVDALGVPGATAEVSVYSPDVEASAPPAHLAAKGGRGSIALTWEPAGPGRTGGYSVERAQLVGGPYELLTPEGLDPKSSRWDDAHVLPGAAYYYRVRAVSANGSLGPAGDAVRAVSLASSPPPAPAGLHADVGATQVRLGWSPVPGDVAGYVLERRAAPDAPRWTRLNAGLLPDAMYTDAVGASAGGTFEYRVTAIGNDEVPGAPSAAIKVALAATEPPPAPIVLAASGDGGRAELRFAPAEPVARTAQVALVRADAAGEDGLVVGAPVAAGAGVIRDEWVRAGQAYWYRLVAFDAAGQRSAESDAYRVRIAAPALPVPKAPLVAYAGTPSPAMTISFDAPPPHVKVLVQAETADGRWRTVAGPLDTTSATDHVPPGPRARYRIVYVREEGGPGVASAAGAPR